MLGNTTAWSKDTVNNELRINTDYSHHQHDVVLLINDAPVTQIEL